MTRLEELTLKLADGALTADEGSELEALLSTEAKGETQYQQLLEVEAALRGQRERLDLAGPTLARLHAELAGSIERGVMQRLESEPPPAWARTGNGSIVPDRARKQNRFADWWKQRWPLPRLSGLGAMAFAASVTLLLVLSVWFFGPTMGAPVLAEVEGAAVVIERGTEFIPAANGIALQAGDRLRTGTNATLKVAFGPEKTWFTLSAKSELKLHSFRSGKRFRLDSGTLEAEVARQRPFSPLIVTTPKAEARVIGTRFTLTVTTNRTQLDVAEGKVRLTDTSIAKAVKVAAGHYAMVAAATELAALPTTGGLLREYWTNVIGDFVGDLEKDRRYPGQPDERAFLKSFEVPPNWGDNYGVRIRGYIHPPVTGDYTFWTAGNTEAFLFVSPDDYPTGAVRVCYGGNTRPRDFDQPQTNEKARKSNPIRMVAGRRYYVEALLKAGVGEDHLAVAWSVPGREREIIPGQYLSPFKPKK